MQQHYGIDLGAPGLLQRRTWRWLRLRVRGLLDIDSRLSAQLTPPQKPEG